MEVVLAALTVLVFNVPLYLVWISGIVVAANRRSRHPRVSSFLIIGLSMLLMISICATIFTSLVPLLVTRDQLSVTQVGVLLASVNGLAQLVNTAAWVLVLMAVFGGRNTPLPYGSRV